MTRIFLANVGANAAHRVRSPIFPDGTFELVTIPEIPGIGGPPMRRYRDLPCFNDPSYPLTDYLPPAARDQYTHADPEFETFTYGDNCGRSPRAAALMQIQPGDFLFFVVRLVRWQAGRFTGPPGFYLAGFLEIERVYANLRAQPPLDDLARIGNNAHVRRGLADPAGWDGFWVFAGTPRSQRFTYAVQFTRALADATMQDAAGRAWVWAGRSELQVIGSYTRSCRCVLSDASDPDGSRREAWWTHIRAMNPHLQSVG